MMRRILTDHVRGHRSAKRGGEAQKVSLDGAPEIAASGKPDQVTSYRAMVVE